MRESGQGTLATRKEAFTFYCRVLPGTTNMSSVAHQLMKMRSSSSLWLRFADSSDSHSFANRLRAARFRLFERFAASVPKPIRILDVGGVNEFWENRGWADRADVQIVILNLFSQQQLHENIRPIIGDGRDLTQFSDRTFDIAFSNSAIEHLSSFESQGRMASEIQRVGRAFWVQTPNFWFPG